MNQDLRQFLSDNSALIRSIAATPRLRVYLPVLTRSVQTAIEIYDLLEGESLTIEAAAERMEMHPNTISEYASALGKGGGIKRTPNRKGKNGRPKTTLTRM